MHAHAHPHTHHTHTSADKVGKVGTVYLSHRSHPSGVLSPCSRAGAFRAVRADCEHCWGLDA